MYSINRLIQVSFSAPANYRLALINRIIKLDKFSSMMINYKKQTHHLIRCSHSLCILIFETLLLVRSKQDEGECFIWLTILANFFFLLFQFEVAIAELALRTLTALSCCQPLKGHKCMPEKDFSCTYTPTRI